MGLRLTACVGVLAALFLLGAVKVEDGQFHFFPGGVGGPGSLATFGVVGDGVTDNTTGLQAAIDSGISPLIFPPGTYVACGLNPRAPAQVWQGAGNGSTILQATAACTNLVVNAGTSGPATYWEATGITFRTGAATSTLISMDANTVLRGYIHNNAFDLGFGIPLSATGGPAGVSWSGGLDLLIEDNEFYSTTPGYGKPINLFRGARNTIINNNTWRWTYQGVEIASLQGSEDILIDGNNGDLGWYASPVKFTNSGGTVTYGASTLTDTAANFSGLCNDTGTPGSCAGNSGNFVRVMTPLVSASATGIFSSPGVITDSSVNYTALGVKRGQIIRTSPVCRGNGLLGQNKRTSCSGGAASGLWGDSCSCTANADCGSGVCEARFTTITGIIDSTHLNIDGWVSDSTRRPVSAPSAGGATYSVYSWVIGQVTSYTSTVITIGLNTTGWFDWFGNLSTPSAGALYEVLNHHPNYNILVDPNALVQKIRVVNNTMNRGYSDQIALQVLASDQLCIVSNNHVADGQDIGIDLFPTGCVASGNVIDHQGTRGIDIAAQSNVDHNTIQDTTWTNTINTTSLGGIHLNGSTGATVDHNIIRYTGIGMVLNRFGISLNGTTVGTVLDSNQFAGTFSTGPYNFQGAAVTATHIRGYQGDVINNVSGTYSIEGGYSTFATGPNVNAALNGSYQGCSDCTVAATCAGAGNGALAKRQNGAWVCN
jgi:hypothetical protein